MNINDYDNVPKEEINYSYVEYYSTNLNLLEKYPPGSEICIKGRRDLEGMIDRIEGEKIIVKIFGETYSVPAEVFNSIFFIYPKEKQNWYEKLK